MHCLEQKNQNATNESQVKTIVFVDLTSLDLNLENDDQIEEERPQ